MTKACSNLALWASGNMCAPNMCSGRCYAKLISREDMAFVLAVLGGAAAVEISKLLHKDKHSPKDLEDLEEKEHELRLLVKASHRLRT